MKGTLEPVAPFTIEVRSGESDVIVLALRGHLDGAAGRTLIETASVAAENEVKRVEIDLGGVSSFTVEGAEALSGCGLLHEALPRGVGLRAAGGAGRAALLAAYAGR